ncbi:amino-acid transporter subunit; membrane component of ABC superfamily [Planktothrix serta PCC 8927]|uniref:Amino-acid transporter subunit membrane component of ABC superfamily n=1 Tax=Planktothrix serta PCC 8927 TaxID=671068 RepID=A0A7Z9BI67_9CYAN|nr:ABC transporter permease subunit [Planktothrix serta]VXD14607.1 amino-acid transporter subunit; membrane component of ABC superfamily [Planktothrix serta PCC 8927]
MTINRDQKIPLWRDERFWRIALQVLVIVIVVSVFALLGGNLTRNLRQTGSNFGFDFLNTSAGFNILDSLIPYTPTDPYSRVLLAGLLNSLRVMFFGIILTTLLGIAVGVARFSDNWLLRQLAFIYVEIVRNTPLLLQLVFWYGIFVQMPPVKNSLTISNSIFLSKQGIFLPWPSGIQGIIGFGVLVICAIAALIVSKKRIKVMVERGESGQPQLITLGIIGIIALLTLIVGLNWQRPMFNPTTNNIEGGLRLTIEFTTLLVSLVVYTAAYIAEIVRAGIQSVPKGQWEAARSLGLKSGLVMQLVVFPQALRVIIPPLNSQYLNLAKNSSLAIAVAYADVYNVATTTFNQTGRAIEVMLIIMATYLTINLFISLGMNQLNRSVQLRER